MDILNTGSALTSSVLARGFLAEYGPFEMVRITGRPSGEGATEPEDDELMFNGSFSLSHLAAGDGPTLSALRAGARGTSWCFWLDSAQSLTLAEAERALDAVADFGVVVFSARSLGVACGGETLLLWPDQWAEHFRKRGFVAVDSLRPWMGQDRDVPPCIAQNVIIYARQEMVRRHAGWQECVVQSPMRMLHPAVFGVRAEGEGVMPFANGVFDPMAPPRIADHLRERWRPPSALKPSISCIVTFHGEGALAHRTLMGLDRVRDFAESRGLSVQLVAVLDVADAETRRVVSGHPVLRREDALIEVINADLGSSRNHGIDACSGDFVGTFDGDDLYSKEWLPRAYDRCMEFNHPVIVHPEWTISFGANFAMHRQRDMTEAGRDYLSVVVENRWAACSFSTRAIYQCVPYSRTDVRRTGFGYEDWHWNLETLAAGVAHVSAPGAALYYRRKQESMVTEMSRMSALIRPSAAFDTIWRQP